MKNLNFLHFLKIFLFAFIVVSCNKNEISSTSDLNTNIENQKKNEATWISSKDGSKGYWARLKIWLGHTAEQCGNACVKIFGEPMHLDCRGWGNVCNHIVDVELVEEEFENSWMLIISDEDFLGEFEVFQFPDRSLYITNPQNNTELWLNIPEQMVIKDSCILQFIIHNIWFSEEPELENE